MTDPRSRLFVALDVETLEAATALMDRLHDTLRGVKIGTQLFTAAGPAAVDAARKRNLRVFLDLKFHDIPNTVGGAVRSATRLGVFMLNVHASGGVAMMRAAAEAATKGAADFTVDRPLVLGVTVLTSLDRKALQREAGVPATVEAHVLHLAGLAREAGLDGCVASPKEIASVRIALGSRWTIVAPGIRADPASAKPAGAATGARHVDDQVRVATAAAAIHAGADYVVVGRPITQAPDPRAAAAAVIGEIAGA